MGGFAQLPQQPDKVMRGLAGVWVVLAQDPAAGEGVLVEVVARWNSSNARKPAAR